MGKSLLFGDKPSGNKLSSVAQLFNKEEIFVKGEDLLSDYHEDKAQAKLKYLIRHA
jgi:hypothetical protein